MTAAFQIKPLEWHQSPFLSLEEWKAEPIKGYLEYMITNNTPHIDEEYLIFINYALKKKASGLNEAMHIAQADFETKIAACLNEQSQ